MIRRPSVSVQAPKFKSPAPPTRNSGNDTSVQQTPNKTIVQSQPSTVTRNSIRRPSTALSSFASPLPISKTHAGHANRSLFQTPRGAALPVTRLSKATPSLATVPSMSTPQYKGGIAKPRAYATPSKPNMSALIIKTQTTNSSTSDTGFTSPSASAMRPNADDVTMSDFQFSSNVPISSALQTPVPKKRPHCIQTPRTSMFSAKKMLTPASSVRKIPGRLRLLDTGNKSIKRPTTRLPTRLTFTKAANDDNTVQPMSLSFNATNAADKNDNSISTSNRIGNGNGSRGDSEFGDNTSDKNSTISDTESSASLNSKHSNTYGHSGSGPTNARDLIKTTSKRVKEQARKFAKCGRLPFNEIETKVKKMQMNNAEMTLQIDELSSERDFLIETLLTLKTILDSNAAQIDGTNADNDGNRGADDDGDGSQSDDCDGDVTMSESPSSTNLRKNDINFRQLITQLRNAAAIPNFNNTDGLVSDGNPMSDVEMEYTISEE